MASAAAFADMWLRNTWLCWGVGPVTASAAGFFLTATILEAVLASSWLDGSLICYSSSSNAPRKQLIAATQQRIPFKKQVRGCCVLLLGLPNVINAVALALMMQWAKPEVPAWLPATLTGAVLQFLALMLVADFGLYWGHRIQHESKFLWKLHSKHHAIDTPTPFSTLFIDRTDAALQGSIPLAVAALLVRPDPAILYLFIAFRIGENAVNHSGMDSKLLDLLTFKLLPFRAAASFHDVHHKYSNHAFNAKNYGESFWIWDWMFGTCSPLTGHAQANASASCSCSQGRLAASCYGISS